MENFVQVQLFTEEECDRILQMPTAYQDRSTMATWKPDWFHGGAYEGVLDEVIQAEDWVQERIKTLLTLTGYGTLNGLWPLIYKEYVTGTDLGYHTDSAKGVKRAGVSITLNSDYTGGELQVLSWRGSMYDNKVENKTIPSKVGLATIFPIFIPHRVTPVLSGTRKQLVTWLIGNNLNW